MIGFRRVCRFLHRELGFLAVGLTLVYAISGVAVNHIADWNPNWVIGEQVFHIDPVAAGETPAVAAAVLAQLRLSEGEIVKTTWRAAPDRLHVFLTNAKLDVELATGKVVRTGHVPRPFFADVNYLHLNHGKGAWTIIADVYAGVLAVMALTGIFLVRGRKGLAGRGGVLLALGLALPLLYLVLGR